jgi:hypothetical protein
MLPEITVLALTAPGTFNPSATVTIVRTLLIAGVSVALVWISLATLFGSARQGNSGKVARVLAAVVLALVPLVIAIGIGASQFGTSIFGWLFPGF